MLWFQQKPVITLLRQTRLQPKEQNYPKLLCSSNPWLPKVNLRLNAGSTQHQQPYWFTPRCRLREWRSTRCHCHSLLFIFQHWCSGGAQGITILFQWYPLLCSFAFPRNLTSQLQSLWFQSMPTTDPILTLWFNNPFYITQEPLNLLIPARVWKWISVTTWCTVQTCVLSLA